MWHLSLRFISTPGSGHSDAQLCIMKIHVGSQNVTTGLGFVNNLIITQKLNMGQNET